MALLRHIGGGIGRGRVHEEPVLEVLALELVARRENVVAAERKVGAGCHGVGGPAVVRAGGRSRLERRDAERPFEEDALGAEPLVRHAVAEACRGSLLEAQEQRTEARLAPVVGIVRRGDEVGERDGHRDPIGDAPDGGWRVVQGGCSLGGVEACDEASIRREAQTHARLHARVVGVVVLVEPVAPREPREADAPGHLIAPGATGDVRSAVENPEGAAFEEQVAFRPPASVRAQEVDHAGDGMRAVEGRAGSPQDLDAIEVGDDDVPEQIRGVALGAARVAEAHAVDQHGGVLRTHASRDHARGRACGAQLLDAQAGHGPQDVGQRDVASSLHLAAIDDGQGLRDLARGLRAVRGGDDHLFTDAAQDEIDLEIDRGVGLDPDAVRAEAREAAGRR